MPVNFEHPQYKANKKYWRRVKDAVSGQDAIKAGGTKYLKKPIEADDERWQHYKDHATYTNYTGHTLRSLIGAAFRNDPKENISEIPELEYLKTDVDGNGLSLNQLAQPVAEDVLSTGRSGLLVDFPAVDGPYSKADLKAFRYRANIRRYTEESIINWRTITVGGKQKLYRVTLVEEIPEYTDEFSFKPVKQYRVLALDDETGFYVQKIYNKSNQLVQVIDTIRTAKGEPLNYIPFVFVGSLNNDPNVDPLPLLDLANENIAMYKNSAEVENMAYNVGMPFLTVYQGKTLTLSQDMQKAIAKQKIIIGSAKAHLLGENYQVDFNQISTDTLAYDLMQDHRQNMIYIGSQIITDATGKTTATEVNSNNSATTSKLAMAVNNTSDAVRTAIFYAADFNGLDIDKEKIEYQISTNFFEKPLDPQIITAQIMLLNNNLVSRKDVIDYLKQSNMLSKSRTLEEIDRGIREDTENRGI